MSGPFGDVITNPEDEFTGFKPIPEGVTLYGVILDAKMYENTIPDGKDNAGKRYQKWNLTFQVLGGEYAKQKVWDAIWVNIHWVNNAGEWTPYRHGSCAKAVDLLEALGYSVTAGEDGVKSTGWMPPNEENFNHLAAGTGLYKDGNPLIGTIIGIETGTRLQVKRAKNKETGEWENVTDANGEPMKEERTTMRTVFPAPSAVKEALAEKLAEWKLVQQANSTGTNFADQAKAAAQLDGVL